MRCHSTLKEQSGLDCTLLRVVTLTRHDKLLWVVASRGTSQGWSGWSVIESAIVGIIIGDGVVSYHGPYSGR